MNQVVKKCTACNNGSVIHEFDAGTAGIHEIWAQCAVCHGSGYMLTDLFVQDGPHVLIRDETFKVEAQGG